MGLREIVSEIRYEIDDALETGGKIGLFLLFLPHIIGAVIAAVIAMTLSLPGTLFLTLAAVFCFLGGMIKSLLVDRQSLIVSVVKNFLIVLLFTAVIAVCVLIVSIRK